MKSFIIIGVISVLCIFITCSCNENNWLKQKPVGLLTASNAFNTQNDFEAAVTNIYGTVRDDIYQSEYHWTALFNTGTDIGERNGNQIPDAQFNNYTNLTPTMGAVEYLWTTCYKIISEANTVIERINNTTVKFDPADRKRQLKAQAMFFRALGYRFLVDIYGGVPLVLKEVKSPKRDFTRASKKAVLKQIIGDLIYATKHLPDVTQRKSDGRLCKAAAYNLLAEIYITAGEYDKAISAASKVISNQHFALMTHRFGAFKNKPGDVYSDLFRFGNQNRQGGLNTEAIWVCESLRDVPGGGRSPQNERWIGPGYYSIIGKDGVHLFIGPTAKNGGRGITWTGATRYADSTIWERSGWNDMRTSKYNILRDRISDNPKSSYYGELVIKNHAVPQQYFGENTWGPSFLKNVPYDDYPSRYILNKKTGLLSGSAGRIDPLNYIMRLAGTYLLRAEAYIDKGDKIDAAKDINVVRKRAHAKPVKPSEVNIDYLLDERARELLWEKPRRLELMRMGKLVQRVRKYNPLSASTIQNYNKLWPLPASEINKNINGTLKQNSGY
jgi:tetratricopeptide (TPR) repeat protein